VNQRPVSNTSAGSGCNRLFLGEVLTDRAGARTQTPGFVRQVRGVDHGMELGQRADLGHRDEVVAPK
jgi:hypothetical protein